MITMLGEVLRAHPYLYGVALLASLFCGFFAGTATTVWFLTQRSKQAIRNLMGESMGVYKDMGAMSANQPLPGTFWGSESQVASSPMPARDKSLPASK